MNPKVHSLYHFFVWASVFLAAGVLFESILFSQLNWDVALYLQVGRWILQGRVPFRDFWETNPPLIMYLNVIPVYLADIAGLTLQMSCNLLLCALVAFGSFFVVRSRSGKSLVLFLLFYWLSVWISIRLGVLGERDQVFSLGFFPYLLVAAAETPRRQGAAVYVLYFLCSLLACLKPSFLFMLAICELLLFFQGSKLSRSHAVALVSPVFGYGILFIVIPGSARNDFWISHVPLMLQHYSTFDSQWSDMWLQGRNYLLSLPVLVGLLWKLSSDDSQLRRLSRPLAVLLFLSAALAVMSQKAWAYHYATTNALSALALALLFKAGKTSLLRTLTFMLLVAHVFAALNGWDQGPVSAARNEAYKSKETKFNYCRKGESVVVFTADPFFIYPMILEKGLIWGSRYVQMYPIVFFSHSPTDEQERLFITRIEEDLEQRQPTVLIFPKGEGYLVRDIDTLEYAKKVGWFPFIESHYDLVAADDGNTIFRLRNKKLVRQ